MFEPMLEAVLSPPYGLYTFWEADPRPGPPPLPANCYAVSEPKPWFIVLPGVGVLMPAPPMA